MSFSHICIIALLATGVASSDSCDANDQACVEDDGPDLSEFLQRAASVNKGEQNSIGMQQATIDRMLDEVQHMGDKRIDGKLPPAQQEQVTSIKEILETSLLPSLESVHDDAQNELGTLIGGISTCNENSVTLHGSIGGQGGVAEVVVSARSSHATCRGDEANKLAAVNAATSDMTAFINSIPTVPAQPLTFGAEENIQYLETVETRLCGLHDQLVTKKQHYDNTTSEHAAATTNCNHLQVQFEQDFCSWRLELTDACNTLQSCYGAAVGAYNTRSAAVQTLEAQWKTEYTGIKKILCFVDIWMSDNDVTTVDDSQLATCDNLQVDTSRMDMTYPDVPPQGSCDTSQVQQYPGTAEFATSEYDQFSATGVADSLTCTALTGQVTTASSPPVLMPNDQCGGGFDDSTASYIYASQEDATAACQARGCSRLCSTQELSGNERCSMGWLSDGKGWWMENGYSGCGNSGYNMCPEACGWWHDTTAAAYCCDCNPCS